MALFTICAMIILNSKQFPGASVSYLQNSTKILNMMEISDVLGHGCFQFFTFVMLSPAESLFCQFIAFGTLAHTSKSVHIKHKPRESLQRRVPMSGVKKVLK